ncbi:alpha/beta fold hydrolase [Actinacidiphila guanduensis]|nr:alpha/beta fold hydrolase [Actinacidiphila guanduensis]
MRLRFHTSLVVAMTLALGGIALGGAPPIDAQPLATAGVAATPTSTAGSKSTTVVNPREEDVTYSNYTFRDGETLAQLRLHYALLGTPHLDRNGQVDNAVLLLHWTFSSSQDLLSPEFQEALFAPGAPFDVNRYFVIIPDAIGHGRSSKPSNGLKAGFPQYSYDDMVDLQHKLVTETLGIPHLKAVVGMSMGCMNAWQWAEDYPDAMDGIMPIACFPAPISGRNLLWRRILVDGIESDPAYDDGNYTQQPPALAEALNVELMMINGVSNLQTEFTSPAQVDGYIHGVDSAATGFDANDFIYAFNASRSFNAEPLLGTIKAKVYAVNLGADEFYPDSLQILEQDMPKVPNGRYVVLPASVDALGHSAMEHPDIWKAQAANFMKWLGE